MENKQTEMRSLLKKIGITKEQVFYLLIADVFYALALNLFYVEIRSQQEGLQA